MKKLFAATIIVLSVAATACDDSVSDLNVSVPETTAPANGDQPDEPGPGDQP